LKSHSPSRCLWVKQFIQRQYRPRFEVACSRRNMKDVWFIVNRLADRHEKILRYLPCAKLGWGQDLDTKSVEKWLKSHQIASEIYDLLSTSPHARELPPNPSLEDVLPLFHGFGDWVVIVGRDNKLAMMLDPEMSDPLVFVPACKSKPPQIA